jgi:hypothetical protein
MEWTKADWFVLGLVLGYFWHPVWTLAKKIVHEAQIASKEWRQPLDKDKH